MLLCQSMRTGSKYSVVCKLQSSYLNPVLLSLRNVTNMSGRINGGNSTERLVLNKKTKKSCLADVSVKENDF